jgi:hypothetical protein
MHVISPTLAGGTGPWAEARDRPELEGLCVRLPIRAEGCGGGSVDGGGDYRKGPRG